MTAATAAAIHFFLVMRKRLRPIFGLVLSSKNNLGVEYKMRRRTKYGIAGVVAIVAGFALIYYFFLKGTKAGESLKGMLHPRISLAPEAERSQLEISDSFSRVGRGTSRAAGDEHGQTRISDYPSRPATISAERES